MSSRVPILLADRDSAVLQSLAFWLAAEGYAAQSFTSGESLLAFEVPASAILVMDHDLGDLTALEVLERLRNRDLHCPALILVSKPQTAVADAARRFGCKLVEKPMLTDDLLHAIRDLASHHPG